MAEALSITVRTLDEQPSLADRVEAFLEAREAPPGAVARIMTVLDELVVNALTHGYPDGSADAFVRVEVRCDGPRVDLSVVDGGAPFNPLAAPEPDTTLDLDAREIGGLGLHLVRRLMDHARYVRADGTNRLDLSVELGH